MSRVMLCQTQSHSTWRIGYSARGTKTDGNIESHAGTKKEPLVRWMAMPNVVTKESPDMQQMGYSLRTTKIDSDAEGRAGQVLARSG